MLLAGLIASCSVASANEESLAKVIAVLDGDTVLLMPVDIRNGPHLFYKFRLADIDAPEKDQDYGEQAKQALAQMVLHQPVRVTTVATDTYGREIGWITLKPGAGPALAVNTELVKRGWAWARSRGRSPHLYDAQQEAQREGKGLWAESNPIPPWIWRKQKQLQQSVE